MKVALLALASFAVFAVATPIVQRADPSTTTEDLNGLTEQARALTEVVNGIGGPVDGLLRGGEVVDGLQKLVNTASTAAQHVASAPQTVFNDGGSLGVFEFTAGLAVVVQDLFAALTQKEQDLFVQKSEIASRLTELGVVFDDIDTALDPLIPSEEPTVGALFAQIGSALDDTKAVYST